MEFEGFSDSLNSLKHGLHLLKTITFINLAQFLFYTAMDMSASGMDRKVTTHQFIQVPLFTCTVCVWHVQ